MVRYLTVRREATAEQVIEKSRFIAHVKPVETREEADLFIKQIKSMHRGATHNVPALVIGEKFEHQWASDDGEPQGTSGVPVLQMMVKENITNTVIVITRYFGGIKLGTGGLVRAYTSSAKLGLEAADVCQVADMNVLKIKTEYTYLGRIQNLEQSGEFMIRDAIYEDQVTLDLVIEPEKTEDIKCILSDLSGGKYTVLEYRKEMIKI
jgi:uncharacterized YigZ family protein